MRRRRPLDPPMTEFDQETYTQLLKEFDKFASCTGLTINYNKTEILRIGSLRNTDASFYSRLPLHWSDGPIKILGIQICTDREQMIKINYNEVLDKIGNIYKVWRTRALMPMGKIQVYNSLIASQVVYKMTCLTDPPEDFYKNIFKCKEDLYRRVMSRKYDMKG